jgi:hypothetical protein
MTLICKIGNIYKTYILKVYHITPSTTWKMRFEFKFNEMKLDLPQRGRGANHAIFKILFILDIEVSDFILA